MLLLTLFSSVDFAYPCASFPFQFSIPRVTPYHRRPHTGTLKRSLRLQADIGANRVGLSKTADVSFRVRNRKTLLNDALRLSVSQLPPVYPT